jgi:hypothetical protein
LIVLFFRAPQGTQDPLQAVAVAVLEFGLAGVDAEQPMGDVAEHDRGGDRPEQDQLQGGRVKAAIELTAFLPAAQGRRIGVIGVGARIGRGLPGAGQASRRIGRGSLNASCR